MRHRGAMAESPNAVPGPIWPTSTNRSDRKPSSVNQPTSCPAAWLSALLARKSSTETRSNAKLPTSAPANPCPLAVIRNGDLLLDGIEVLVVFYPDFNPSDSYVCLRRVEDTTGLSQALGPGSVQTAFSRPSIFGWQSLTCRVNRCFLGSVSWGLGRERQFAIRRPARSKRLLAKPLHLKHL